MTLCILYRFWMMPPLLNLIIVLILLHRLVIRLDDAHLVSMGQCYVSYAFNLGENRVWLKVAGVHLCLDNERLKHVEDLCLHDRVRYLLASLDNVTNSNNSSIHDIIILEQSFI